MNENEKSANKHSTQGARKMKLYLEELIRNDEFKKKIKRLNKLEPLPYPRHEQKVKREDELFANIISIAEKYKELEKQTRRIYKKLQFGKAEKIKESISEQYGLDLDEIFISRILLANNLDSVYLDHAKYLEQSLDMCKIWDSYDELLSDSDSGKNIVSLNPRLRLGITASKIAIKIHPRASKRDVLDFVAKRWPWIESQLRTMSTDKALRTRKRKHSQKLLDFMWQNRSYTAKEIKRRLNKSFPNNGLAYHEISKIIDYEGKKRFGELT